jgi:hypothetical protein
MPLLTTILLLAATTEAALDPKLSLHTEAAAVWQSRNDVGIPATDGTRFSLVDLGAGPVLGGRVYGQIQLWDRHELRALYAPFSLAQQGAYPTDISYMGESFAGGEDLESLYVFNSYRITYRYTVLEREKTTVKLGFTGKLRDAEIALDQGETSASRMNRGFVPLLHVAVEQRLTDDIGLLLDADGLWSPYGRAEDVALMATFDITPWARGLVGYRTVEGGSDGGGDVFTFAWLHFAALGLQIGQR